MKDGSLIVEYIYIYIPNLFCSSLLRVHNNNDIHLNLLSVFLLSAVISIFDAIKVASICSYFEF